MRIVLGLGNPGERYRATRHNLGYRVVDRLADRLGVELRADGVTRGPAWTVEVELGGRAAILAKPRTWMNRSGAAAASLCRLHDAPPAELLVVYDDADLDLGRIRLRPAGRAAGHRGVESIIRVFGTETFPRVRLGVRGEGRERAELVDYVLQEFAPDERPVAEALVELGADAIEAVFATDLTTAMNRFNSCRATAGP